MRSVNKTKILGYLAFFAGIVVIALDLLLDSIRGQSFDLGLGQILLLIPGALIAVLGLILAGSRPKEVFAKIWNFLRSDAFLTAILIVIFALFALLFFLGKWEGMTPSSELWSDSALIAGYGAAYDHPENFTGDLILSNPDHYAPYKLFLLPLVSVLTRFTGDYSLSLLIFLPVSMFLQLLGFYLLGRKLFKSKILAVLLPLLCAVNIQYGASDYWGFFTDPQPRFLYQAVLPYLLLLFFSVKSKPKFWPLVMFAAGLAGFIHMLSGPAVAFMIWAGLFFCKPSQLSYLKLILYQVLNGLVYLATAMPVILVYLTISRSPADAVGGTAGKTAGFAANMAVILPRVREVIATYLQTLIQYWIIIPAVISVILVLWIYKDQRQRLTLLLVWLAALYFVALGMPILIQVILGEYHMVPLSVELIRDLRYTFPIFFIIILLGIEGILALLQDTNKKYQVPAAVLLLAVLGLWFKNSDNLFSRSPYFYENMVHKEIACFKEEKLFCPMSSRVDAKNALIFIREHTAISDRVLAIPNFQLAEQIRYGGLRTSVLVIGDSSRLEYTETPIGPLSEVYQEYNNLANPDKSIELDGFVTFACRLDADYLLIDETISPDIIRGNNRVRMEMQNDTYKVVKITDCVQ
jgi:hypothetical protein